MTITRYRVYKRTTYILLAALLLVGWHAYNVQRTTNTLLTQTKSDLQLWLHAYSRSIRNLDYNLAAALSAYSVEARQDYLQQALDEVSHLNKSVPLNYMAAASQTSAVSFDIISYHMLSYLRYAAAEQANPLKPLQYQNLQLMRDYSSILQEFLEAAERQVADTPPAQFVNNRELTELAQAAGGKHSSLPPIAKGDKEFNDWLYLQHPYRVREPSQMIANETKYTEEELGQRARSFMGPLWTGPKQQGMIRTGGRVMPAIGEIFELQAADQGQPGSAYIVDISQSGGHILRARWEGSYGEGLDTPAKELMPEEARTLAQGLIDRWTEPPEGMVLHQSDTSQAPYRFTYVPLREGYPVLQQEVVIEIDPSTGRLNNFDAGSYFTYYNMEIPLKPELTPDEVKQRVGPYLKITGQPILQARNGDLVYAIPVQGVDRVSLIYIDAVSGKEAGLEYNWPY